MTILITGGTGIIGSNVARLLIEQGRQVLLMARRPFATPRHVLRDLAGRYELITGDVTDPAYILNVVNKYKVEGIIHLASLLASASNTRPLEALQVNVLGSANVLEAARTAGLHRVILTSSSVLYGQDDIFRPHREEEIALPVSGIYPTSKLAVEQLANTYRTVYGVDTAALRPHIIYGPGEMVGNPSIQWIDFMVRDALAGKAIAYESGGDSVAELTYVKDHAKGVVQAYDAPALPYHVYNLGYGRNWTMLEVADVLRHLFPGLKIEVGPGLWAGPQGAGQKPIAHSVGQRPPHDISRARRDFGYNPEWPIERAIPDWIKWLKYQQY